MRLPTGEMLGAHPPERLEGADRDLERRHAEVLEPELELVLDAGHDDLVLGILEDGRDRPGQVARPCRPRLASSDLDPAGEAAAVEVRHEAGERAQERRLSRPGRPEQTDELARLDLQRDVVQRRPPVAWIAIGQAIDSG